jgi:hypothetical protein
MVLPLFVINFDASILKLIGIEQFDTDQMMLARDFFICLKATLFYDLFDVDQMPYGLP